MIPRASVAVSLLSQALFSMEVGPRVARAWHALATNGPIRAVGQNLRPPRAETRHGIAGRASERDAPEVSGKDLGVGPKKVPKMDPW